MLGTGVALAAEALLPVNEAGLFGGAADSSGTAALAYLGAFLICCSGGALRYVAGRCAEARRAEARAQRPARASPGCCPRARRPAAALAHVAWLLPSRALPPPPTLLTPSPTPPSHPPAVGLASRMHRPLTSRRLLEPVIASLTSKRRSFSGVSQTNVDRWGGCEGGRVGGG